MDMKNNLFIVLDGLDGAGKGEQIARLHNYLYKKNKRFRILTTREPTYGKYGRKIRDILGKEKDPMSNAEKLLELYIRDREEHLSETIEPFLSEKDNFNLVLCDRYYYSTIAFQSTQGIPMPLVIEANKKFRKPDLALILDLPPELALRRIRHGRPLEKFEHAGFMIDLRANFMKMAGSLKDNIKIVDASKSKEQVFDQIKKEVDKLL